MICAWPQLLSIIPQKYRVYVEREGVGKLQEIRMRYGKSIELICKDRTCWIPGTASEEDLVFCVQNASQFSPWASNSISSGFITAPGGHRIGICGEVSINKQGVIAYKNITSLCIRVANEIAGISMQMKNLCGSTLIIGKPGSGKTTLLRDYINYRSERNREHIMVIDERRELFPYVEGRFVFQPYKLVDVLTGSTKAWGIKNGIKVMNPDVIAVDEITSVEDSTAILTAANCGVMIIATAHGNCAEDYKNRPIYQPLYMHRVFEHLICMKSDKTWTEEDPAYVI